MNIYFGHTKKIDFLNDYYIPIEESEVLQKENLIFPHKEDVNNKHTREFYSTLDAFFAEVSYPATGLGIELGWTSDDKVPIYCFYKQGTKPNSSLKCITDNLIEYENSKDLVEKIERNIVELKEQKKKEQKSLTKKIQNY